MEEMRKTNKLVKTLICLFLRHLLEASFSRGRLRDGHHLACLRWRCGADGQRDARIDYNPSAFIRHFVWARVVPLDIQSDWQWFTSVISNCPNNINNQRILQHHHQHHHESHHNAQVWTYLITFSISLFGFGHSISLNNYIHRSSSECLYDML